MGKNTRPNTDKRHAGGPRGVSKYAAKVAMRLETGQIGSSWVSGYSDLATRELFDGEQLGVVVNTFSLKGFFFCRPDISYGQQRDVYVSLAYVNLAYMPSLGTPVAFRSRCGNTNLFASTLRILE